MNNFNFTRFANFGKYDYTINKTFYRNTSLLTIFMALGITLIGFMARYLMFAGSKLPVDEAILLDFNSMGYNPANTFFTNMTLFIFASTMSAILAGHAFHNLRNKQGRIMELTMPATNLERWTWHVLVSAVGATVLIILSIVCADIFNAILNLIIFHGKVNSSFTKDMFAMISGTLEPLSEALSVFKLGVVYWRLLISVGILSSIALYIFGNSLKYKYNIILTYISLYIIQTIISVGGLSIILATVNINDGHTSMHSVGQFFHHTALGTVIISGIITILCFWGSYKFYCKAQITSRRNK